MRWDISSFAVSHRFWNECPTTQQVESTAAASVPTSAFEIDRSKV
jgi:hypothetical protein